MYQIGRVPYLVCVDEEERKRNLPYLELARRAVVEELDRQGVPERQRATYLATGRGSISPSSARNLLSPKRSVGADVLTVVEQRLGMDRGALTNLARFGDGTAVGEHVALAGSPADVSALSDVELYDLVQRTRATADEYNRAAEEYERALRERLARP